jgi:hypothetical protein
MPVAEQAALPARIPSLFRIAARLRQPVAELSTGTCEVPFFAAALMPSAGINLHQSPVHIRAPRALTWGIQMMKFPRRRFLHLATGAAALPAVSRIAWAHRRSNKGNPPTRQRVR